MNIFAYGTLMDKPFVERMLGHSVRMERAVLDDHVRLRPSFYMVFPRKGDVVEGVVIFDLSHDDVSRFDRYEGHGFGYYDRRPVVVHNGWESGIKAESYLGGEHMQWYYENWLEDQASHN